MIEEKPKDPALGLQDGRDTAHGIAGMFCTPVCLLHVMYALATGSQKRAQQGWNQGTDGLDGLGLSFVLFCLHICRSTCIDFCIYVYMYTCITVYICVQIFRCVCVYLCMYICINMCVRMHVYVTIDVQINSCSTSCSTCVLRFRSASCGCCRARPSAHAPCWSWRTSGRLASISCFVRVRNMSKHGMIHHVHVQACLHTYMYLYMYM